MEQLSTAIPEPKPSNDSDESLEVKIMYNKKVYPLNLKSSQTMNELKNEIHSRTSVAPDLQKLILRGRNITNNSGTLEECGIKNKDKILMVGSTIYEVSSITTSGKDVDNTKPVTTGPQLKFCKQNIHKKIVDAGPPQNAMPAYRNGDEDLPSEGVKGLLNRFRKKTRLTFKLDSYEMWICAENQTQKYDIQDVESVEDQPIDGHEEYSIVGIHLNSTIIWLYWVPQQYLRAIRAILT